MIAPFKPAAECDDRDVIHLKGFAARLDFADAYKESDRLVRDFRKQNEAAMLPDLFALSSGVRNWGQRSKFLIY